MEYIKSRADEIQNDMLTNGWTHYRVSTCDHYLWDIELHRNMPAVAEELRIRGFEVVSSNNWGVTDWDITVKL